LHVVGHVWTLNVARTLLGHHDLAIATTQGMSALARDGASRSRLKALVDAAMDAWPRDA